jgi:hypothetical protein
MNTRQKRNYPARLEGLRQRFERWRQTHPARSRIADPLWTAAVKMAGAYGIHRTARALRINYYALKKRMERESAAASGLLEEGASATFIELPPPAPAGSCQGISGLCECTLELGDVSGAKLRVHLQGIVAPDLATLCRSLRSCSS